MTFGWNAKHHRYLSLARHVAEWSKDPSTKTGCALIRPDGTVASVGYNGFPRGVNDAYARLQDRSVKYPMTVHAETNAILSAHASVAGCTAYVWPWPPCASCAGNVIQAGIRDIWTVEATPEQVERWGDSFEIMRTMLHEAGVRLNEIPARWMDD